MNTLNSEGSIRVPSIRLRSLRSLPVERRKGAKFCRGTMGASVLGGVRQVSGMPGTVAEMTGTIGGRDRGSNTGQLIPLYRKIGYIQAKQYCV